MFQNYWQNCEFRKPTSTINSSVCFELCSFRLWLSYEYVWEIARLCLTAVIWNATWDNISVFGFLWNLLYYAECGQCHCKLHPLKMLVYPEISSANKLSIIKRTFHWLPTARSPKIVTILMTIIGNGWIFISSYFIKFLKKFYLKNTKWCLIVLKKCIRQSKIGSPDLQIYFYFNL